MRQLDAGQVADQHAMRVQRAFGLAGGAGGVDHHRRIVGGGIDGRELRRRPRQQFGKAAGAVAFAVDRQHAVKIRHFAANAVELGEPLRVGQQRPGAGILQAIGQRIRAEQHGDRQGDGAELVDRDMRGRHFRRLRQHDGDAVAALDALRAQHVGETIGGFAQGAEADGLFAPVRMHMQDGEPRGIGVCPAVADIDADIVARRHLPAELAIDVVVIVEMRQHRHGPQTSQRCARSRARLSFSLSDSIFKQPTLRRPYSLRPRAGRLSLFRPRKAEGMEHRVAHQSSVLPRSLLENAGASRRSIAAISDPRVRVSWFPSRFLRLGPQRQFGSSPCRALARRKQVERSQSSELLAEGS